MTNALGGLHHVTAVTAHAADNVAFYTQALGLRLVKKTVNQDDVSAYHLFYADASGSAGTEMTFFDWAMAAPNRAGRGEVAVTAFRVTDRETLDWWVRRFDEQGIAHGPVTEREGRALVAFVDPEGQRLELIDDSRLAGARPGQPWSESPIPPERQLRGLSAVTLVVGRLEPTAGILTRLLGFRQVNQAPTADGHSAALFECGPGGPGTQVRLVARPDLGMAQQGRGGVHHVAFRTPDDEQHQWWQEHLAAAGVHVTPVIDRYYFRSIYFREPGGVLFEIATDGPGFATDEDAEHLGERLSLPPFLEPHRARIEAGLRHVAAADAS